MICKQIVFIGHTSFICLSGLLAAVWHIWKRVQKHCLTSYNERTSLFVQRTIYIVPTHETSLFFSLQIHYVFVDLGCMYHPPPPNSSAPHTKRTSIKDLWQTYFLALLYKNAYFHIHKVGYIFSIPVFHLYRSIYLPKRSTAYLKCVHYQIIKLVSIIYSNLCTIGNR